MTCPHCHSDIRPERRVDCDEPLITTFRCPCCGVDVTEEVWEQLDEKEEI